MDENNGKIHQLLGELVATVRSTGEAVSQLSSDLKNHTNKFDLLQQRFTELEVGLKNANREIRDLHSTVVTPEKLRRAGLDLDDHVEHSKDFRHLREIRQAAEERKPIYRNAVGAVISAGAVAVAAYFWGAGTNQIRQDLTINQPTKQEASK